MTDYERSALDQLRQWQTRKTKGVLAKLSRVTSWPAEKIGDGVMKAPIVGRVIELTFEKLIGLLSDASSWSVRTGAVFADFRDHGFAHIDNFQAIGELSLEEIDGVVRHLDHKYQALAAAEGGAVGMMGALGLTADIVSVIALNLRAISEYAAYYGFDAADPDEKIFALNILLLASSPSENERSLAVQQLSKMTKAIGKKMGRRSLTDQVLSKVIDRMARTLGANLTEAKIAQIIPIAGSAVGAGFNARYTGKVCDAARLLYRQQFLVRKYGTEILEDDKTPDAE